VLARVAQGATQEQAYSEIVSLTAQVAAASPRTHQHLRPRILAYGGESPGDRAIVEILVTHLPIVLVLIVACVNVGTLVYARTATREAEIVTRYALGASRWRIVSQLFVESLVLAALAATVGLTAAHFALKWGVAAYYSGSSTGMPFWVRPGLKLTTVIYAGGLTIVGAALLSLLPAIKVTGSGVQSQLRNLGVGGSTLRFGGVWTAAMIAQVALTVICIPPAAGISHEAWRDRIIRDRFPAERYLTAELGLDRDSTATGEQAETAFRRRFERVYQEVVDRIAQEPGVSAVTFGDRLPGMGPSTASAEFEADVTPGAKPRLIPTLWRATVGSNYFQAFDVPLVAGRDFRDGDRAEGARTVIVNEAFARRYFDGATPIGRRVRYATSDGGPEQPWFEIVGMVRDVGMTPTDLGEAPYIFHGAAVAAVSPLVLAVRTSGDPAALSTRLRNIAASIEPDLRLSDVRTLDDIVWRVDTPAMVAAGAIVTVVALGLFMSAAGIFSLMSVSVSRRAREIGLRTALGATRGRVLAGVLSKAAILVGSGIAAGNAVLLLVVALGPEVDVADVAAPLLVTSVVMAAVGFVACVEPARRALRIAPTEALKES
jgi:predicted permease